MKNIHIMLYSRFTQAIADFVTEHLHTAATLTIHGALDGLSDERLRAMQANPIAKGVPVELNDGSYLYVDHDQIDAIARTRIEQLQKQGNHTVLMCCTLPWPSLENMPGVICPSPVLEANAMALLPKGGTLGVIQPYEETSKEEIKHWLALGPSVIARTVSAHDESPQNLTQAVTQLIDEGCDLIVLDCLEFTREHLAAIRQITHKPVILPISLLGNILNEAYGPF